MRLHYLTQEFPNHFYYRKLLAKLNPLELDILLSFAELNAELSIGDFEFKLNRFFLDRAKPKRWGIISELLCCANARYRIELQERASR